MEKLNIYLSQETETKPSGDKDSGKDTQSEDYLKEILTLLKEEKQAREKQEQADTRASEEVTTSQSEQLQLLHKDMVQLHTDITFQNSMFCGVVGFVFLWWVLYKVFWEHFIRNL